MHECSGLWFVLTIYHIHLESSLLLKSKCSNVLTYQRINVLNAVTYYYSGFVLTVYHRKALPSPETCVREQKGLKFRCWKLILHPNYTFPNVHDHVSNKQCNNHHHLKTVLEHNTSKCNVRLTAFRKTEASFSGASSHFSSSFENVLRNKRTLLVPVIYSPDSFSLSHASKTEIGTRY